LNEDNTQHIAKSYSQSFLQIECRIVHVPLLCFIWIAAECWRISYCHRHHDSAEPIIPAYCFRVWFLYNLKCIDYITKQLKAPQQQFLTCIQNSEEKSLSGI
jgi:hypothetical protein